MGWQETDPDQNRAPPPPAEDPEEDEEDDSDEEEDLVFDAQQAQEQARHDAVMAELRAESDLLNAQVQAQDIELEQIAQMTAEIRRQTLIREEEIRLLRQKTEERKNQGTTDDPNSQESAPAPKSP